MRLLLLICLILSGCGLTGDLYLPDTAEPENTEEETRKDRR